MSYLHKTKLKSDIDRKSEQISMKPEDNHKTAEQFSFHIQAL